MQSLYIEFDNGTSATYEVHEAQRVVDILAGCDTTRITHIETC